METGYTMNIRYYNESSFLIIFNWFHLFLAFYETKSLLHH